MERSRPRCEGRHEPSGAGGFTERRVRPDRVVVASPAFDDDLGLAQSIEDLPIEQRIASRHDCGAVAAAECTICPPARSLQLFFALRHGANDNQQALCGVLEPGLHMDGSKNLEIGCVSIPSGWMDSEQKHAGAAGFFDIDR